MPTRSLPQAIPLHRGTMATLADALVAGWKRWRHARQSARLWHEAEQAERELRLLHPRSLADIGAPEGLVGHPRWPHEPWGPDTGRLIDLRGG